MVFLYACNKLNKKDTHTHAHLPYYLQYFSNTNPPDVGEVYADKELWFTHHGALSTKLGAAPFLVSVEAIFLSEIEQYILNAYE